MRFGMAIALGLLVAATLAGGVPRGEEAGDEKKPLADWIYPGAKPYHEGTGYSSDSRLAVADGQFWTEAPFHEVVRHYVEKIGVTPPNWSILGREFPGDAIGNPAFFSWFRADGPVTVLHHIRPGSASCSFLATGRGETLNIVVSRDLKEEKTFVQIVKHYEKE